jgi:hypothetical protein
VSAAQLRKSRRSRHGCHYRSQGKQTRSLRYQSEREKNLS